MGSAVCPDTSGPGRRARTGIADRDQCAVDQHAGAYERPCRDRHAAARRRGAVGRRGVSPEPLKPKYDLGFGQPTGQAKPEKANGGPGIVAQGIALGVTAARQIEAALVTKPTPPAPPPPPDPETDRHALVDLQRRYGAVPLSEVGQSDAAKAIRSDIFHNVAPSVWEQEAHERAAARLAEARDNHEKRLKIRAARGDIEALSRAAEEGKFISTAHGGSLVPRSRASSVIDAIGNAITGNLLVLATRGKLDAEGRGTVDDRIDIDPRRGLIVYDASSGKGPEVRPWGEVGKTYEIKVREPAILVETNTVLGRMRQKGLDIADLGRVQIVDRQQGPQGEVEADVPMLRAKEFVAKVLKVKEQHDLAEERTPGELEVFPPTDLVPVPREAAMSPAPQYFDTKTIIIAPDPAAFFRASLADTQPLRPFRRGGNGNGNEGEDLFEDAWDLYESR